MPQVLLFQDDAGNCPFLEWMDGLPQKAQDKVTVRVERLAELGRKLHRPEPDFLRDGIYELRATWQKVNHRVH